MLNPDFKKLVIYSLEFFKNFYNPNRTNTTLSLVVDYNDNYSVQYTCESKNQSEVTFEILSSDMMNGKYPDDFILEDTIFIDEILNNIDTHISFIQEEIEKYDKL